LRSPAWWAALGRFALAAGLLFLPILWAAAVHVRLPRDARAVLIGLTLAGPWLPAAVWSIFRPGLRAAIPWGVASALLFWAAFPPLGLWPAAYLALVPWCVMTSRTASALDWWLVSVAFAQSAFGGASFWINYSTELGWAGQVGITESYYLLLAFPLLRWLVRRGGLSWTLALPPVWVAAEWLRTVGEISFPWMFLGHTQAPAAALIQVADLTGVSAVTLIVATVNGLLADLWLNRAAVASAPRAWLPRIAAVAGLLALSAAYGAFRLWETDRAAKPGPVVLAVQTNEPQFVRDDLRTDNGKGDAEYFAEGLALAREGLARAAAAGAPARLVIWPEAFCRRGPLNPEFLEFDPRRLNDKGRAAQREGRAALETFKAFGDPPTSAYALAGYIGYIPTLDMNGWSFGTANCALYTAPADAPAGVRTYQKIHLVPWGEFIPGRETFPFLWNWFVGFMPYGRPLETLPGDIDHFRPLRLRVGADPEAASTEYFHFASPICFEDTDASLCRRMTLAPDGDKRVDFLVNISNDGWFEGSSELDMHHAIACFRAVENRVGVVRAVNTGVSGFIDTAGRPVSRVTVDGRDRQVAGTVSDRVWIDDRVTVYTRNGDWLSAVCLAATGLLALVSVVFPTPKTNAADRSGG
jgi:apolipoprotein N-acyltransferase